MAEPIVGDGLAGATDTSYGPVKVGGKYNSTQPTLTDGQRGDAQLDSRGGLKVSLQGIGAASTLRTAGVEAQSNIGDASSNIPGSWMAVLAGMAAQNGTTWDRWRNNMDTAALITASGATTSQTGTDQTNYNGRGVKVVLDMTVVGTGSVTVTIQGKDAASGKYYTLLAGAAVVTNVTNVYEVYPGCIAAANAVANATLPRVWRVITTANNANATTYTVGASVIV